MIEPIPAILMLPPWGSSPAERWMAGARFAAAADLVSRLNGLPQFDPILLLAAEIADAERLAAVGARPVSHPGEDFHFGRALAEGIRTQRLNRFIYFGGASAPLVSQEVLAEFAERMNEAGPGQAIVNNLHSTDWAFIHGGQAVLDLVDRFPTDNTLAWVLEREAGFAVQDLPPCAATRLDLDTPTDLWMAAGHPDLGPQLAAFLESAPSAWLARRREILGLFDTPGAQLTLIGRVSPGAWQALGRRTQIWARVFAEERGMVASRRHAEGEVRSLVHELIEQVAPAGFVERLAKMADGALWDTRVWMSARGGWPSTADRYASDLGRIEAIEDPALQELTLAISQASIPIVAGGHGVVAGGLLALLESLGGGDRSGARR